MTALDLAPIRERLEAATPGPWRRGDNQYIDVVDKKTGKCVYCDRGEPTWVGMRSISGRRMQAHVHTAPKPRWDHCVYAEREDGNLIVVHDTYEYGYMEEADAELIAHAPADIAALLAEVESLRKRLADVEALHSSFPLFTVPCEHDEDCNCIELSNGEYYEPDHHEPACETCSGGMDCCDEHMVPWPCPTVLAARGEQ